MSAPFRELFVELPRAVFDVLHGVGVVAVSNGFALKNKEERTFGSALCDVFGNPTTAALLRKRFGWSSYVVRRAADVPEVHLVALYPCGHRSRIRFDEDLLAISLEPMDDVFRILERSTRGRPCHCVQQKVER